MHGYRSVIKKVFPPPIWRKVNQVRYTLDRAVQWPLAAFHPWRRTSIKRLSEFQSIHRGKRCFIIGNGPSLKQTDLTRLRGEYSFGMNRIYLHFPESGFTTTYYVCINGLVIEQCINDIRRLTMPKFLSWHSRHVFETLASDGSYPEQNTIFLHSTYTGPKFAQDVRGRLWEGATVTYVTLQLAYFMGFEQVILIGIDHNYTTQGPPNTTVVSQGEDPNHFNAGYFGKGFRWQLPDLETSEIAYSMAREAYCRAGRQVLDATIGGKLDIFPKVDYSSLF
jgi:hypothetical protein